MKNVSIQVSIDEEKLDILTLSHKGDLLQSSGQTNRKIQRRKRPCRLESTYR
jgi:hypothetical protein